ncbi:MAG: hypothetical protein JO364_00125 [Pseudonocardiales bacterium]|nr:hypothetical protein [Pseudonocardiales bacterium]MBV9028717.1 hypothetical protein [Pseudonocardiales bacterium]
MTDPAVFDRPELAALWSEVRRRFEAAGDGEVRTVRLSGLDPTQRAELWAELERHPLVVALPALCGWVDGLRRGGLIGGCVTACREHLHAALAVPAELPATGEPLPVLAERVLSDPHALDEGTRLSGTVLRGLAALRDEPPPADAEGRRHLWAMHGVTGDELSTTVLVAGFTRRTRARSAPR